MANEMFAISVGKLDYTCAQNCSDRPESCPVKRLTFGRGAVLSNEISSEICLSQTWLSAQSTELEVTGKHLKLFSKYRVNMQERQASEHQKYEQICQTFSLFPSLVVSQKRVIVSVLFLPLKRKKFLLKLNSISSLKQYFKFIQRCIFSW